VQPDCLLVERLFWDTRLPLAGLESARFEPTALRWSIRTCGNECVFCFVDQNPTGLRPTLYVKDEDYRLSFLHGNFVTLTNMKEWEIRRVVEQRLSPIYLSIHSSNPETRRRLLRSRKERDIFPTLDYFREHNITMHTQVVVCPGYNDGVDLDGTIRDLAAYHPAVQSLGIVPLGMTDHRDGLIALDPVTPELARDLLERVEAHQRDFRARWGIRFLYLADEWYRMLGRLVPPEPHYDGFPQLENGIGMTRVFLNRLARQRRVFPWRDGRKRRVTVVTGSLFRPIIEPALTAKLARTGEPVEVAMAGVENEFLGPGVTVAGLLAGGDIIRALRGRDLGDAVFIPPATLNDDDLFLDDLTLEGLRAEVGVPVHPGFRDRAW
jgi:putative radical SAM enzyme (TIGR03279 family)